MRFPVVLALVGLVLGGLAAIPSFSRIAQVQAREVASGTQDAPRLTDVEFQRLYERMTGIWARRPDKSTYTGSAPPDRLYVIYEAGGDRGIKYTNRMFSPDGRETTSSSSQVLDGRDYPTAPDSDRAIARLPLNEYTIDTTARRAGKLTARNTQFFDADGQRMSIIVRNIDEDGEHLIQISVFDKVERVGE